MKEPSAKTLQEQAAGRLAITRDMLGGMIDQICMDYRIARHTVKMNADGLDARQWTITTTLAVGVSHTENAWEWPTDELKTMVLLTSK